MGTLLSTIVFVQTREAPLWARSSDDLVLIVGGSRHVLGRPPERGLGKMYVVPSFSWDPAADGTVALAIDGNNAWVPREAIVMGYWEDGGPATVGGLALGFRNFDSPSVVVSGDTSEGLDPWQLERFQRAGPDDPLTDFLLVLDTGHRSKGPFELQIYSVIGTIPVLSYQARLPTVGQQAPGDSGIYFFRFRMNGPTGAPPLGWSMIPELTCSSIAGIVISNRSDDGWGVKGGALFGWSFGHDGLRGGMVSWHIANNWISQESTDAVPPPGSGGTTGFWPPARDALRLNVNPYGLPAWIPS